MGFWSSLFGFGGGGEEESGGGDYQPLIQIPSFYEDSYYKPTQDKLLKVGEDFLMGKSPNAFYDEIASTGGPEFENALSLIQRDTTKAADEASIRRGVGRSGIATDQVTKAVSDVTQKLRYQDFLRALEGKQFFMNTGIDALGGVRSAGLTYQGQKNSYELSKAGLMLQEAQLRDQINKGNKSDDALWGDLLSAGISSIGAFSQSSGGGGKAGSDSSGSMWDQLLKAGLVAGGAAIGGSVGGPVGATIGGQLGSAAAGQIGKKKAA